MLRRATMLRSLRLGTALLGALLPAVPAGAQEAWPSRPITLLSGFPNASGIDLYARKLAEPLSRALGQPIVVDNRSGAGGNIGLDVVAKAKPDGTTFGMAQTSNLAINPTL